jgi:hypothetical protein
MMLLEHEHLDHEHLLEQQDSMFPPPCIAPGILRKPSLKRQASWSPCAKAYVTLAQHDRQQGVVTVRWQRLWQRYQCLCWLPSSLGREGWGEPVDLFIARPMLIEQALSSRCLHPAAGKSEIIARIMLVPTNPLIPQRASEGTAPAAAKSAPCASAREQTPPWCRMGAALAASLEQTEGRSRHSARSCL